MRAFTPIKHAVPISELQAKPLNSPLDATVSKRMPEALRTTFLQVKKEQKLRNRDAAIAIGVSEGEAMAACIGIEAIRLRPDFIALLEEIPQLGAVMALTRNDSAEHEKEGTYENMSHTGLTGLALGREINLRMFYAQWYFGCAVIEETAHGTQKSLQFFDHHGTAVHKIFLREDSNHAAFDALVARWRDHDQAPDLHVTPAPPAIVEIPDGDVDVKGFQAAWHGMNDAHQFFGIMRSHGVNRTQALRLGAAEYARQVDNSALKILLNIAVNDAIPMMIFVGNVGLIQIHSGPVTHIKLNGAWINVLGPAFNLHLLETNIVNSWVVRKPTSEGGVTSLELFDQHGQTIAMLFGERRPGQAELPAWRDAVTQLPDPLSL
ncbi:hemin-degrading factor [Glaciimonas immobilis]|uniref:Putative hemin transport protein n=1 Tax=Glaciimonas immobilis TaxID=728004 RepID=A0A840RRK0_9BURK|nr:ChuX/HutX family heme-like substrate-binding protein [Glaciimonas immobilis]KAF3996954.1 hemin-degrading factor [Glaciimonas immobilis]MBB5199782.1 putative hemin transport protein [Glaciimonas immobilis]